MTSQSFDGLRKTKGRVGNGCARCGENSAGIVNVVLRSNKHSEHLASKSKTFCESCCVEVFDLLVAQLAAQANEGKAP